MSRGPSLLNSSGNRRKESLTEAQAHDLWSRAADLQASAEKEAERIAAGTSDISDDVAGDRSQVSLEIAREAAVHSGIDGRYVDQALRELRVDRKLDNRAGARRWIRALRAKNGTIAERYSFASQPAEVRDAVVSVAQSTPFALELVDVMEPGCDTTAYVYEVPGEGKGGGTFHHQVRSMSDVKRVAIMVVPNSKGGTDAEFYCRLDNSVLINGIALRIIQAIGAAAGVGVGFALIGLLARITGLDAPTAVSILRGALATFMGLGMGTLTGKACRAFYQRQLTKVRMSFRKLLLAAKSRLDTGRRQSESD